MYPASFQVGDEVRVIAPARSLALISQECQMIANNTLADLGLHLSFSEFVAERDDFDSTTIAHRVQDLHNAFRDTRVKGIVSVIGGYNSNQLLNYIDWDIIKHNPKIFCGFSDITVLNNAIWAKTGLVTYSGPHYSSLGQKLHLEYTLEYFRKCLFSKDSFTVFPSQFWTDDPWYLNQDARFQRPNPGMWILQTGEGHGTILGGNLCSLNLLQGTKFFPQANYPTLLFLEDTATTTPALFDRDLQSLLQAMSSRHIVGLVIGRFQEQSGISKEHLTAIIQSKRELAGKPIVANADFGHTDPRITFPIGGIASLKVEGEKASLAIVKH